MWADRTFLATIGVYLAMYCPIFLPIILEQACTSMLVGPEHLVFRQHHQMFGPWLIFAQNGVANCSSHRTVESFQEATPLPTDFVLRILVALSRKLSNHFVVLTTCETAKTSSGLRKIPNIDTHSLELLPESAERFQGLKPVNVIQLLDRVVCRRIVLVQVVVEGGYDEVFVVGHRKFDIESIHIW